MRPSSLQVKVTLAIVLSLLVIDGVGAAVAEFNFRESEMENVLMAGESRLDALEHVIDLRLHTLGQNVADVAQTVHLSDAEALRTQLRRAGFTATLAAGPDGIMWTGGDAAFNESLADAMLNTPPAPSFPGRVITYKDGWVLFGVRAVNQKYAAVGAIDRDTLTNSFLTDVLIEAKSANVVVSRDGELIASSLTYMGSDNLVALQGKDRATLDDGKTYIVIQKPLTVVQGFVAHLVPLDTVEARVDALVFRFVATSTSAVVIAGIATVFIVAYALRPLRRITDAARRLGAGEDHLELEIRTRDEMGILADVLNQSAAAIADARRAQEAHASELRLAAEDFEVAVGGLARSVGAADSAPEIARRLSGAIVLITSSRAVATFQREELLEIGVAEGAGEALDANAVRALLASDPDAFTWLSMNEDGEDVRVALLPAPKCEITDADRRKVEILLNQAALAFHRTRSMDNLRRAHAELDVLVRQKQMFVDILSHDLKNPIAVARGRIEMLSMKHPDLAERCIPIEQSLDRATGIIEEAVLFSKLEGAAATDQPAVDLAVVAADATQALQPLAAARGIEVACSSPASVPWKASPLLGRAIENILSNAIKWSPERSTVVVDVEPSPEACRIRIIDHGPGIPPDDRKRLFARFERADRTGVKGTGLGLAIAKRVVDLHAGRILIEDTPGGGSTFVIELPARAASPAPNAAVPATKEGSA